MPKSRHAFTPAANSSRRRPSRRRASARSVAPASLSGLCQPRIPEDRKERSASAVRKRIGPALAIVDDESLDGHGLHSPLSLAFPVNKIPISAAIGSRGAQAMVLLVLRFVAAS